MKKLFSLFVAVALIVSIGSLALLASADYVPSVEWGDGAPVIVSPDVDPEDLPDDHDPDDEIIGVIIDGEDQKTYVPRSKATIISLQQAYVLIDVENQDALIVELCNSLINANNSLKPSVAEAIKGIDEFAGGLGFVKPEYAVRNIFEFSIDGGLESDEVIRVIFENNMDVADGSFIVAHQVDGEWIIVDKDKVVFDGDNITVEFDHLCPVAFIAVEETYEETTTGGVEDTTEGTTEPADDDADENGGKAWIWIVVVSAVVIVGGVTVYVLYKKGIIRFKK